MCKETPLRTVAEIIENTRATAHACWTELSSQLPTFDSLRYRTDPAQVINETISVPIQRYTQERLPDVIRSFKVTPAPNPDCGWLSWFAGMPSRMTIAAYNPIVDVVANNAHRAVGPLATVMSDIAERVPRETFDALNPAHLLILGSHYPQVQQYFTQRVEQVTRPYAFYKDFRGEIINAITATPTSFRIAYSHYAASEGVSHLGHTAIDLTESYIAEKIGVAMAIFSVYQIPRSVRTATNASFEQLFSRSTAVGLTARMFPVRFTLSRPLARIHGNPVLSIGVLAYLTAMSVAKSIQDSEELREANPKLHGLLESRGESGRELVASSWHLNLLRGLDAQR